MNGVVKVAGVQMEPRILEKEENLSQCLKMIQVTAKAGARLIVFPECALTGYVFNSLEEAAPMAEPIPGPSTEKMLDACREFNVYVIVGLLEREAGMVFNSAALLGPRGLVGKYRKLHLPYLGVDRFLKHGDLPPTVFETEVGRIGIGICYDARFPEHARVLTLQGAEMIVYPTNLADLDGKLKSEYVIFTRAFENQVYCMSVNRVGVERGFKFAGRSRIVDVTGGPPLAEGRPYEEDIIYAEIEPAAARDKHSVFIKGEFEVCFIEDRRPEFYGPIVEPLTNRSRIR